MINRRNHDSPGVDMIIGEPYDAQPLTINDADYQNELNSFKKVHQQNNGPKERMYYADWLRAMSIHFVIMVHCDQLCMEACDILNPAVFARVEYNEEVIEKARGFIKSLVQCGIPIFFYISGMATTYFDTLRKG